MPDQTKQIHVVGSVDTQQGTGEFLYVNPTTAVDMTAAAGAGPPAETPDAGTGFELVVENADGDELERTHPDIMLPSDAGDSTEGLIDQRIRQTEGMARLKLLYDGQVIATYEAGAATPAAQAPLPISVEEGAGAFPADPGKRRLEFSDYSEPVPGVSYTVQVRPAGDAVWQTIAVGRETPGVVIDSDQFPNTESATVRVLRTTGFDDAVVAEGDVDLSY